MPGHETEYAAIRHVGAKLGVGPEMLRKSVAVPRPIPANGRVWPEMSLPRSGGSGVRTRSCGGRTRFCEQRR